MIPILVPNLRNRTNPAKKAYTLNLHEEVIADMDALAKFSGMKTVDIVRHAINTVLDAQESVGVGENNVPSEEKHS